MALTRVTSKVIQDGTISTADLSTASKSSISGSFNETSSSFSTRTTTLESASSSFAGDLVTIKGSGTTQGVGQSNSPTFAGGTVTGDFTVGGTLTAQEVHTEFTSASILFTSGSTKTGNSLDDVHTVTGSMRVSSSLGINGVPTNPLHIVGSSLYASTATNLSTSTTKASLRIQGSRDASTSIWAGTLANDAQTYLQACNGAGNSADDLVLNPFGGNVGIGIGNASPTTFTGFTTLHHKNTSGNAIQLVETDGGVIHQIISTDDSSGFSLIGTRSNHTLRIGTNDSTALTIDTSQRVGIGTVSPSGSLHVQAANPTVYITNTTQDGASTLLRMTERKEVDGDAGGFLRYVGSNNWFEIGTHISGTDTVHFYLPRDSSGKVGIGTNNPASFVHIYKNANSSESLRIQNDDTMTTLGVSSDGYSFISLQHNLAIASWDGSTWAHQAWITDDARITMGNAATDSGRASTGSVFRANSNGNAAVTLLSPSNHSAGVGQDIVSLNFASNNEWSASKDGVYAQIRCENGDGTYADRGQLVFATGYNGNTINDRVIIRSTGVIGIESGDSSGTGATQGIHIDTGGVPFIRFQETNSSGGTADFEIYAANGTYALYDVDDSANVYSVSTSQVISGDFNDTSDIGLKENIKTIDSGLSIVNKLNPVTFDWKNKKKGSNSGFIAQEVEKLLPDDVEGEDFNTDYPSGRVGDVIENEDKGFMNVGKSINLGGIVAHLTKAVQELSARIEELEK